jgi:excisionase family DNA binding protein
VITNDVSELINFTEAADFLGISRVWLYVLIEKGRLHPVQVADRQFLRKSEVQSYKESNREE